MDQAQPWVNSKLQRKWLAALRSGKYRQHKGSLASPEYQAFCCQGVACELAPKITRTQGGGYQCRDVKGANVIWPHSLMKALGLTIHQTGLLTEMNDEGVPFPEIAATAERFMKMNGTYYE